MPDEETSAPLDFAAGELTELILALWRAERRGRRNEQTPEPVTMAIETAMDRARDLGFSFDEMVGTPYHENMRVRVIQHDAGEGEPRISECLTPAVYFRKTLIKPAEVIIEGAVHVAANS